eukprot:2460309-Prymnesium_polylepis.1
MGGGGEGWRRTSDGGANSRPARTSIRVPSDSSGGATGGDGDDRVGGRGSGGGRPVWPPLLPWSSSPEYGPRSTCSGARHSGLVQPADAVYYVVRSDRHGTSPRAARPCA